LLSFEAPKRFAAKDSIVKIHFFRQTQTAHQVIY